MTYYRVDFLAAQSAAKPAKRFRTQEQAEKHARRVLGLPADIKLVSQVAIVSVGRDKLPL